MKESKFFGKLLVSLQFALLFTVLLSPQRENPNQFLQNLGVGVAAAGLILIAISFSELRPSLTVMPEPKTGAPLITSGIYKYVRHPIYSGLIVGGLGVVVYQQTLLTVMAWVFLTTVLKVKLRYEDRLLLERWPEARTYQESVGLLFPRIRRRGDG